MTQKRSWRLTRAGETRDEKFNRLLPRGDENACWEWPSLGTNGYGVLCHQRRRYYAHRLSYELHKGPIPEGLHILHSCDNKACANPAHLHAGTHAENMREAAERGLMVGHTSMRGRNHPLAKLTEEQARDIKYSGKSGYALWKKYGVAYSLIYRIKSGQSWPHI